MKRHMDGRRASSVVAMATKAEPGEIIAYVEGLFTYDADGEYVSVACVKEEFAVLLSGRLPPSLVGTGILPFPHINFEDEQEGMKLFQTKYGELSRAQVKNLGQKAIFPPEDAYQKRITELSLLGRLEHYSFTNFVPAVATTLARGQIEAWDGLSFDANSVTNLLQTAAEQGDPEANYLLAAVGNWDAEEESAKFRGRDFLVADENQRARHFQFAREVGHQGALRLEQMQIMRSEADTELERWQAEDEIKSLRKQAESGDPKVICQLALALAALAVKREEARLEIQKNTHWAYNKAALDRRAKIDQQKRAEICKLQAESQQFYAEAARTYPPALFWIVISDESDEDRIIRWRAAAYPAEGKERSNDALLELARLYSREGTPSFSLQAAVKCLDDAIKLGTRSAIYELGSWGARHELARIILKHGEKSGKERGEVGRLLKEELGIEDFLETYDTSAAFLLARCYLRGEGVDQDVFRAQSLFNRWRRLPIPDSSDALAVYGKVACWLIQQHTKFYEAASWLLIQRLDYLDFKPETEPMLSYKDLVHFQKSIEDQSLREVAPSYFTNATGVGDEFFLAVSLSALEWEDLSSWSETDIDAWNKKTISQHYFLGRLWLNGRFGRIDLDKAEFHLSQVVQQANERLLVEKKLNIRHAASAREMLRWLQGRANQWLLEAKNRKLEQTNKELRNAQAELEDMMAMFAHKFRGPVDSIISNAEHHLENRDHLFKDLGRTMNGLLDIFSFVSSHSEKLLPRLQEDNGGPHGLTHVLHKALWLTVVQLLTKRNIERMNKLYFMYALKEGRIPANSTFSDWRRERPMRDVREAIRTTWEMDIGAYGDFTDLEGLLAWLASKLVVIQVDGVSTSNIRFSDSGTKESLLLVILTEILVNAIKHYEPSSERPIYIRWSVDGKQAVFSCENPTSDTARKRGEGSGRGLKFLSMIARNVAGEFRPPGDTDDDALVEFSFPIKLFE